MIQLEFRRTIPNLGGYFGEGGCRYPCGRRAGQSTEGTFTPFSRSRAWSVEVTAVPSTLRLTSVLLTNHRAQESHLLCLLCLRTDE